MYIVEISLGWRSKWTMDMVEPVLMLVQAHKGARSDLFDAGQTTQEQEERDRWGGGRTLSGLAG
jgi:hypothetical protein